jgi:hypothetical protein
MSNSRRRSGSAAISNTANDTGDKEFDQALTAAIAAGLIVPDGVRFEGGRWQTIWRRAEHADKEDLQ